MLCTLYNYTVLFACSCVFPLFKSIFVSAGNSGVVREGLTNPLIPNGWSWGGVVSDHCPVWVEIYVGKDLDIADLSTGAEAIKFTLGTEGWTTKFHLHFFFISSMELHFIHFFFIILKNLAITLFLVSVNRIIISFQIGCSSIWVWLLVSNYGEK